MQILGVDPGAIGFREEAAFAQLNNIKRFRGPLLIVHAEFDHIIPFSDAQALFDASASADKTLLKIPAADHNDILALGLKDYFGAIQRLTSSSLNPHDS